jgi:hypothetical protein
MEIWDCVERMENLDFSSILNTIGKFDSDLTNEMRPPELHPITEYVNENWHSFIEDYFKKTVIVL